MPNNKKTSDKKELLLKKEDGTTIWTRNQELVEELKGEDYKISEELKGQFDTLIKKCHQILYNNGAIVGKSAMNDIMKILTLKLLQPLFEDGQILKEKYDEYLSQNPEDMKKIKDSYIQCTDFRKLKASNFSNEWKSLINNLLTRILGTIYDDKDISFNANDETIKKVISKINSCSVFEKLTKEKNGIKYYDSISGNIYEYFMNKYFSGGGKSLGQFFTPRYMIDMMIYGLNIQDHIDNKGKLSIYDPCAGSGGFLTRLYNCIPGIKPKRIYGGEVEKDTMKFCISNLLLTTSTFCENLVNENSIIYENGKKHNIILTNPPFGTSMKYKRHIVKEDGKSVKKDGLMEEYDRKYPDGIKFTKVYPIQTNDGACLFTQKCVYKLKENGLLSIVLPDGQLFFGKNFKKFRKWLSEQMNIKFIVQAPSGVFDHAGIKTCVLMATKDGPTQKIQFLKTNKECSELKKIVEIDSKDLELGEYSLDPKDYLEDEYLSRMLNDSYVEWKALGDLCSFKSGVRNSIKEQFIKSGKYGYIRIKNLNYTSSDMVYLNNTLYNKYITSSVKENDILISSVTNDISSMIVPKAWNDYIFNGALIRIRKKSEKIYGKYLFHIINSEIFNRTNIQKSHGSIQQNIVIIELIKYKIPLPSLEIQQKIVNNLDQLENQAKTLKELLEHTKKEKEIYQNFGLVKESRDLLRGCERKTLEELCEIKNGKRIVKDRVKSGKYSVYGGGGVTFTTNIFNREGKTCKVSREGMSEDNCVLILNEKYYLNSQALTIESGTKLLLNGYLWNFLLHNKSKIYSCGRGTAQKAIDMEKFNTIKIPLPSLEIQEKCIEVYQRKEARLNKYDDELQSIKDKLKELQELGKHVIEFYIGTDNQQVNED